VGGPRSFNRGISFVAAFVLKERAPMTRRAETARDGSSRGVLFGRRFTLCTLFGFRLNLDVSWLFLVLLVTWSLAAGFFPMRVPGLTPVIYWSMGIAGTVGLMASLVFHELSHSLVARRFGMRIRGITLFIFGGVAEMTDEPPSAMAELLMALAGPAASLVLSALLYALALIGVTAGAPVAFNVVTVYLSLINLALAVFNLVPAYPLDGGRVLRALLWRWKNDIRRATRLAAAAGSGFGFLLMAMGFFAAIVGHDVITGVWWFIIGLFLHSAARAAYMQVMMRDLLCNTMAAALMTAYPITVPPGITLAALVEDFIYAHHHQQFPVVDHGRLVGVVGAREVRSVPRGQWAVQSVAEVMAPCTDANCIDAHTPAQRALSLMNETGNTRLAVTDRGQLVGILTLKDLLRVIALRLDLETRG
jgi:Zn-dependent protease/CBS domain-containing protein